MRVTQILNPHLPCTLVWSWLTDKAHLRAVEARSDDLSRGDVRGFFVMILVRGRGVCTLDVRDQWPDSRRTMVPSLCFFPCFVCNHGCILQIEVSCGPLSVIHGFQKCWCGVVHHLVEAFEKWFCT